MINFLFNLYNRNKYEIEEIKTYSSREWLYDNSKIYQTIFYRYDVDYVYFELSLFNRYYKRKNWSCSATIFLYNISFGEEELMAKFEFDRVIEKEEKIIYIREGWGNKNKGAFWKKGAYKYKIYIESDYISEVTFHVEDAALISTDTNQYFEIESSKLFEDGYEKAPVNRVYKNEFVSDQTRYVFCELIIKNLLNKEWIGEFKMNIHTASGDLKGKIYEYCSLEEDENQKEITMGFGSQILGSLNKGDYVYKISFFNYPILEMPFTMV